MQSIRSAQFVFMNFLHLPFRCFVDMRRETAVIVNTVLTISNFIVFGISGFSYAAVWIKIYQTTQLLQDVGHSTAQNNVRVQRTAKSMTLFVFSYMVQWSPYITYSIWSYFSLPPLEVLVLTVIFLNMGGVHNACAYTIMRKFYDTKDKKERQNDDKQQPKAVKKASGNLAQCIGIDYGLGVINSCVPHP